MIVEGKDRRNKILSIIGAALLLIGIALLVMKGLSVEYVDADGILHENFFLLPCGFSCIFCGLVFWMVMEARTVICRFRKNKGKPNEGKRETL